MIKYLNEEEFRYNSLTDDEKRYIFNLFRDSYLKSVGTHWSEEKFIKKTKDWLFFGDKINGFIAVKENNGIFKLVISAGSLSSVINGINELLSLNKPVWGLSNDKLKNFLVKKFNFISPNKEEILKMKKLFSDEFLANKEYIINDDGTFTFNYDDVGVSNKYFVANELFFNKINKQKMNLSSLINEADYSLHKGDLSNANKPYGGWKDNLYAMSGRSTGHFGSGTYISTYKNEDKELYNKYIDVPYYRQNITKVEKGLYVIDLDKYNLYKPSGKRVADFLFSTLRLINQFFYTFDDLNSKGIVLNDFKKRRLQIIINNLKKLNLKLPPLKDCLDIINKLQQILHRAQESKPPTLATLIMEYNGFNGVNVNNIDGWDNPTHGSVIYDLKKFDDNRYSTETQNVSTEYIKDKNNKIILKYNEKFYQKINRNTTIKRINYYINELTEPLEKFDWENLDNFLQKGEITKEVYNHILKIYSFKLKKLINDGLDIYKLNKFDIIALLSKGDFDYINKNYNLEKLMRFIYENKIFYLDIVKKYLKTIDKEKLEDKHYYDEIMSLF
jgi:hypothetical protein